MRQTSFNVRTHVTRFLKAKTLEHKHLLLAFSVRNLSHVYHPIQRRLSHAIQEKFSSQHQEPVTTKVFLITVSMDDGHLSVHWTVLLRLWPAVNWDTLTTAVSHYIHAIYIYIYCFFFHIFLSLGAGIITDNRFSPTTNMSSFQNITCQGGESSLRDCVVYWDCISTCTTPYSIRCYSNTYTTQSSIYFL